MVCVPLHVIINSEKRGDCAHQIRDSCSAIRIRFRDSSQTSMFILIACVKGRVVLTLYSIYKREEQFQEPTPIISSLYSIVKRSH